MISKTKIFISRPITENSPFNQLNRFANIVLFGESLISFNPVEFKVTETYGWVFFYSKNAVKFFLNGLTHSLSNSIKIACIGNKTAQFVKSKIGRDAEFIAEGDSDQSVRLFKEKIVHEKVLFPRASRSQKSIQKYIPTHQVIDLIVYRNIAKESISIPHCDILVFTSPLNFETYLKHYLIDNNQIIVAIGNTTAQAIRKSIDHPILVADEASEEGITGLIIEHLQL